MMIVLYTYEIMFAWEVKRDSRAAISWEEELKESKGITFLHVNCEKNNLVDKLLKIKF